LAERIGKVVRFVKLGRQNLDLDFVAGPNVWTVGLSSRDLLPPSGLWWAVQRCDLILDIGLSDSFAGIHGVSRAFKILVSKLVVPAACRTLVPSRQTVGSFKWIWAWGMARWIMVRARAVLTRDALSTVFLSEMGYSSAVIEMTDVALRLTNEAPECVDKRSDCPPRAGLNVSCLLINGSYGKRNKFALSLDYPQTVDCRSGDADTGLERVITGFEAQETLAREIAGSLACEFERLGRYETVLEELFVEIAGRAAAVGRP